MTIDILSCSTLSERLNEMWMSADTDPRLVADMLQETLIDLGCQDEEPTIDRDRERRLQTLVSRGMGRPDEEGDE